MPVQLTPAQALDPDTVERLAMAECAYDRIMSGAWPLSSWWPPSDAELWRVKARELLTELVEDTRG